MKKIILIALLFLLPTPSFAENIAKSELQEQVVRDENKENLIKGEDQYVDEYNKVTLQNLSRLYWKKEMLEFDDDDAIDNFIRINDCDFFVKNWRDDIRWKKVRAATRMMIKEKLPDFTDKYRITIPITLGRYDESKKGFALVDSAAISDMQRVIMRSETYVPCEQDDPKNEIDKYPKNVLLILAKPFTYDFLPLSERDAQAYILRHNDREDSRRQYKNEMRVLKQHERRAYLRMRVRLLEYQGEVDGADNKVTALMFGLIEGVDIFENSNETGLLYTENF